MVKHLIIGTLERQSSARLGGYLEALVDRNVFRGPLVSISVSKPEEITEEQYKEEEARRAAKEITESLLRRTAPNYFPRADPPVYLHGVTVLSEGDANDVAQRLRHKRGFIDLASKIYTTWILPNPMSLGFDPKKPNDTEVRKIFKDDIARTLWMGLKFSHLTDGGFPGRCLRFAEYLKKNGVPQNAMEFYKQARVVFGREYDIEAFLEIHQYLCGERKLEYNVSPKKELATARR